MVYLATVFTLMLATVVSFAYPSDRKLRFNFIEAMKQVEDEKYHKQAEIDLYRRLLRVSQRRDLQYNNGYNGGYQQQNSYSRYNNQYNNGYYNNGQSNGYYNQQGSYYNNQGQNNNNGQYYNKNKGQYYNKNKGQYYSNNNGQNNYNQGNQNNYANQYQYGQTNNNYYPIYQYQIDTGDMDGALNLTNYALKYIGCQNINTWNDGAAQGDGYASPLVMNRFAMFRLCDKNSCSSFNKWGCNNNYGEYIIPMDDYMKIMAEYHFAQYGRYCETCSGCMNYTGTVNDDTSSNNDDNTDDYSTGDDDGVNKYKNQASKNNGGYYANSNYVYGGGNRRTQYYGVSCYLSTKYLYIELLQPSHLCIACW